MPQPVSSAVRSSRARKPYKCLGTSVMTLVIGVACDLISEFLRGLF
jgi:hypothetical protein